MATGRNTLEAMDALLDTLPPDGDPTDPNSLIREDQPGGWEQVAGFETGDMPLRDGQFQLNNMDTADMSTTLEGEQPGTLLVPDPQDQAGDAQPEDETLQGSQSMEEVQPDHISVDQQAQLGEFVALVTDLAANLDALDQLALLLGDADFSASVYDLATQADAALTDLMRRVGGSGLRSSLMAARDRAQAVAGAIGDAFDESGMDLPSGSGLQGFGKYKPTPPPLRTRGMGQLTAPWTPLDLTLSAPVDAPPLPDISWPGTWGIAPLTTYGLTTPAPVDTGSSWNWGSFLSGTRDLLGVTADALRLADAGRRVVTGQGLPAPAPPAPRSVAAQQFAAQLGQSVGGLPLWGWLAMGAGALLLLSGGGRRR